ncbi:MAG: hypothetical protein QM231_09450 [Chloroflexota bacterium]|nr:hypothetical protein [Chloroflexota bacterium]
MNPIDHPQSATKARHFSKGVVEDNPNHHFAALWSSSTRRWKRMERYPAGTCPIRTTPSVQYGQKPHPSEDGKLVPASAIGNDKV